MGVILRMTQEESNGHTKDHRINPYLVWLWVLRSCLSPLSAQTNQQPSAKPTTSTNISGQSVTAIAIQNQQSQQIKSLLNGKPTITGYPAYKQGINCTNSTGNCITFNDGTKQNTAAVSNTGISSNTFVRISYSSGTTSIAQSFSFVMQSTNTYMWDYSVTGSSGTNSTNQPFQCLVNGDTNVAHYFQEMQSYANAYVINNAGGTGNLAMNSCGGGAVNATDFSKGRWYFSTPSGSSNVLVFTATWSESCQTRAVRNSNFGGGYYLGSGPYTVTCTPLASLGWSYESTLYISSPTPTIVGPTGPQGPSGTFGGSGTTNNIPVFTAATTLGNSAIVDDGTNITASELTQFGNGVNKSSFTTSGNLQLVSGSTITSNGTVTISTSATAASAIKSIFINNSGQTTFTPNISSVTVSAALSGTFTTTALGPCISGSTVTLTIPPNDSSIFVGFNGTASVSSLAAIIGTGILLDGAYINGETSSKALTAPQEAVATDGTNISFSTLLTGLSSGQHNVCLSLFVSAGTGTIDSTNSAAKLWMYSLP